jgi:hypothetical protein
MSGLPQVILAGKVVPIEHRSRFVPALHDYCLGNACPDEADPCAPSAPSHAPTEAKVGCG